MVALTAVSFSCEPDGVKEAGFSDQQHKAECGSRASISEIRVSRQHYKGQCAASADKDSKTESWRLQKLLISAVETKRSCLLPQRPVF